MKEGKNKIFWGDVYKAATGLDVDVSNTYIAPLFTEIAIRPSEKSEFEKAVRVIGRFCNMFAKFEYLYDSIMYKGTANPGEFSVLLKTKIRVENALMKAYDANYIPMFDFKRNSVLSNSGIGLVHNKFKAHLENCIHNANLQLSHQRYVDGTRLHATSSFLDEKRKEISSMF